MADNKRRISVNPNTGTGSTTEATSAGGPFAGWEGLISQIQGAGEDPKAKNKADKDLAKLQGQIQQQLVNLQAQHAAAQQATQIAATAALQQGQQNYQRPFDTAEVTGMFEGQQTLQSKQFDRTAQLQQEAQDLDAEIERGQLQLNNLKVTLDNAIAQGNLALANVTQTQLYDIQNRQLALENYKVTKQNEYAEAELTGSFRGNITESARATRAREAMERGALTGKYINPETGQEMDTQQAKEFAAQFGLDTTRVMGRDANGNLTDDAQQWRTNAALDYARTAAQLATNPADYFESAAFMRGAGASGATGFLQDINANGIGSNVGFRSAATGLPAVNSMQNIATAGGAPPSFPIPQVPGAGNEMAPGFPTGPKDPNAPQLNMTGYATEGDRMMYAGGNPSFNEAAPAAGSVEQYRTNAPSGSIGDATAAVQGSPQNFTTTMHTDPAMPFNLEVDKARQAMMLENRSAQQNMAPPTAPSVPGVAMPPANTGAMPVGQQSTYTPQVQARLNAFAPTLQAGAHKLKPGAMEAMNPTEKSLFQSAAKASGVNPQDFESAYQRSRLQTNVSATAI